MDSTPLAITSSGLSFLWGLLPEVPCFRGGIVYQRELGERAYEVGRGNKRATRQNLLRESDSEAQSDHAMLLGRTLAVDELTDERPQPNVGIPSFRVK